MSQFSDVMTAIELCATLVEQSNEILYDCLKTNVGRGGVGMWVGPGVVGVA